MDNTYNNINLNLESNSDSDSDSDSSISENDEYFYYSKYKIILKNIKKYIKLKNYSYIKDKEYEKDKVPTNHNFKNFVNKIRDEDYYIFDLIDINKIKINIIFFKKNSTYITNTIDFKKVIDKLNKQNKNKEIKIILISYDKLSTYIKKIINNAYGYIDFIILNYNNFINPFKIPLGFIKCKILTDIEIDNLLNKDLQVNRLCLPKIYYDDPMIIWTNGKIGDIVKIISPSNISGLRCYYRLIIDRD
tara:strand:- start:4060 stop:4800 length:741 start_codon:yes stop_codon:yes gene_type:complete